MLLVTLGANLLGNLLTGKGILRACSGNKKGKGILRTGFRKKERKRNFKSWFWKKWHF